MTEYERVTFDKDAVTVDDSAIRAELVCPGHALLGGLVSTVNDKYASSMSTGVTMIDPSDMTDRVRVLVALEHTVTDGRIVNGQRKTVSKRFQFVEIDQSSDISDPGAEPYLNYRPITEEETSLIANVPTSWANGGIDDVARNWATAYLAGPHHEEVREIVSARVTRVRIAVQQRLDSEIRFWICEQRS